jgi:hypothetical protein
MQKLDVDQRNFCLRLHAEGYDTGVIRKELKEKWQITITAKGLFDTFRAKKHQPTIKAFRDDYLQKVKSVPIANKRYRMDDLERERERINRLIKTSPMKTRADKSLYLSLVGELRRLIEMAREEMEKKPHLFQNVNVAMGDMDDEQLDNRKQLLYEKINKHNGRGTSRAQPDSTGTGQEIT